MNQKLNIYNTGVYKKITDKIIEELKRGVVPWRKPWICSANSAINYVTRKRYSILNSLMLGKPGEYLTFKQAKNLGGHVKQGAKGCPIVFCKTLSDSNHKTPTYENEDTEIEDIETPKKQTNGKFYLQYSYVFHLDDTEGIPSKLVAPEKPFQKIPSADKIICDYLDREQTLQYEEETYSNSAYYSVLDDKVVLPDTKRFISNEEFYSTSFHEFIHSTGHPKRLDRFKEEKVAAFGSEDYSREELVAEIGSVILCNTCGIDGEKAFKNSASYINGWIQKLSDDNNAIFYASKKAEEAVQFMLSALEQNDTAQA